MRWRATGRAARARRSAAPDAPRGGAGDAPLSRLAWMGMAGLVALMLAFAQTPAQSQEPVPEPDGYRMEAYRAPTPAALKGAEVVDTPSAEKMWREGTVLFVDVMPRDVKPANLPIGTIWRDKKREHIPGSVWLPNVGYGVLNAEMDGWYRARLADAAGGRIDAPLLFYCMTDCWMSWNAAKRAMEYGYTAVIWYPAGADGWAKAGLPLEEATPKL